MVHLTISPNAKHIANMEMGLDIDLETGHIKGLTEGFFEWVIYHHYTHVGAAPASGSYGINAVAVVPCSMGTLGRIAHGTSDNLAVRMADVALKERRPLIVVPRETPIQYYSFEQHANLVSGGSNYSARQSRFLHHLPKSVDEMVNFVVGRILQQLGIESDSLLKGGWGEINSISTRTHLESNDDYPTS